MKRRLVFLAVTTLSVAAMLIVGLTFASPASADGTRQISGVGAYASTSECNDLAPGYDYALILTGDLEGCLYTYVESSVCTPGETYMEVGREIFVDGATGSRFETTYKFEAKYADCASFTAEKVGRCQHPIVKGTGTGEYSDVDGQINFKDDVVTGNFPYTGHIK